MRDPRTPTCAILDCPKAARRLGLCSEHAALAPSDAGIKLALACLRAQVALRREHHARAALAVTELLLERALEEERAEA